MKRRNFLSSMVAAAVSLATPVIAMAKPKTGKQVFESWTPLDRSYVFLPGANYSVNEITYPEGTRFYSVMESWTSNDSQHRHVAVYYIPYDDPLAWEKDPCHVIYETMLKHAKKRSKELWEKRGEMAYLGMNERGPGIFLSGAQVNRFLAS